MICHLEIQMQLWDEGKNGHYDLYRSEKHAEPVPCGNAIQINCLSLCDKSMCPSEKQNHNFIGSHLVQSLTRKAM